MHKKNKTNFVGFCSFELSSVGMMMMMMMEVKCASIMHNEAKSKQAGCSRIKILFQYDAFLEKRKIKNK